MAKPHVLAICCADLHLSLRPPLARACEPDWFAAMQRPIDEMRRLASKHDVPILCAGDVFDRWNSPPELINFALRCFLPDEESPPIVLTVAGQHDLAMHQPESLNRTALGTLVESDAVGFLTKDNPVAVFNGFTCQSAGWNEPIPDPLDVYQSRLKVILVHGYIWNGPSTGFPGADPKQYVEPWREKLKGYDVAIFGDNHIGFQSPGKPFIFNCGGFMRRRSDQLNYQPRVGLLLSDGTVKPHPLDISQEQMEFDLAESEERAADFSEFVRELNTLQNDPLNFEDAIREAIKARKPDDPVRKVLTEVLG